MKKFRFICFLAAFIFMWGPHSSLAQYGERFEAGEITEKTVSPIDTTQQYAVFLPSDYDTKRKWPVVFVMDPRGRALHALDLFRETADELGYILISSYNTMSDGPAQPNIDAINAMINDAPRFFSVDEKRYYFAGFSGTAIMSWNFGYQLKDNIAGVIGFGGGPRGFFLPYAVKTQGIAFSYFGGATYHDFNYFEMAELDFKLDEYDFPHAEVFFEGIHSWPGAGIVGDALYWMELRAMKEQLRELDDAVVSRYMAEQMEKAKELEESGYKYEAYRRYRIAREVCDGLTDVDSLDENIDRLKRHREVRKAPKRLKRHSDRVSKYLSETAEYFNEVREMNAAPTADEIRDEISLESLMKDMKKADNRFEERAYRVMLENIYVKVSFYEPRHFLRSGKPEFSLSMLRVADQIKPGSIRNCYFFARTYAEMNNNDEAFEALECLKKAGWLSVKMLETDSYLKKLAGDPRMAQLKRELGSKSKR